MTVFIVEDEAPALERLETLVKSNPNLELAGSASKGKEAIEKIETLHPDLLFLDVHLPDISGLDILKVVHWKPRVIFTTAYDQYALQAFEHDAIDFLLKPFSRERFEHAVQKALQKAPAARHIDAGQLQDLLSKLPVQMDKLTHIPSKIGAKIYILKTADIVYFKSEDKVVTAYLTDNRYIVNYTLDELQQRLDSSQFIRIHRSTIVNLNFVHSIEPLLGGTYLMKMADRNRTELNVSRSAAKIIREQLGW